MSQGDEEKNAADESGESPRPAQWRIESDTLTDEDARILNEHYDVNWRGDEVANTT